jgi:hypothetical protein
MWFGPLDDHVRTTTGSALLDRVDTERHMRFGQDFLNSERNLSQSPSYTV